MAKNFKKIYVLIAFSYDSKCIKNTVSSLLENHAPFTTEVEILLVENGIKSFHKDYFNQLNASPFNLSYSYYPEGGKSKALNFAIKNLLDVDSFIIFSDDDITFNKNWIINYLQAFKKFGPNHFFGGAFKCAYQDKPDPNILHLMPKSARGANDDYYIRNSTSLFLGFNWAAFAKDIVDVGYFNEALGPGTGTSGQETEMQKRLLANSVERVFVNDNSVIHFVPADKISLEWTKQRAKKIAIGKKLKEDRFSVRLKDTLKTVTVLFKNSPKNLKAYYYTAKVACIRLYHTI